MDNHLGCKLVAVLDRNKLRLFKAEGLKISEEIEGLDLHNDDKEKSERVKNLRSDKTGISSFHDPHTSQKDIDLGHSAKVAIEHINYLITHDTKYKGLYIIADSKLLGHIRQTLNTNLKKLVVKEVSKDLISHNISDIEKALFA